MSESIYSLIDRLILIDILGEFHAAASRPPYDFTRSQGCRNVIRRIFNIFLAIFGPCLEVARQLQGNLEITAQLTCNFARCEAEAVATQFLRFVSRRPQVSCANNCDCLAFVTRLPQKYYEAYDNCRFSHSSCAAVLW